LPSNLPSLGALPRRFRRPRILLVGCGDIGLRVVKAHPQIHWRVLTSSPERVPALRALGLTPLVGNLDRPQDLGRLAGLASRVLFLAPPPGQGRTDPRSQALLKVLALRGGLRGSVYGSTSGVYGDCGGVWVDESRPVNPQSDRAWRRVDAEARWRHFGRALATPVSVLRIPGIYAPDREGGTPLGRLRQGLPVLAAQDDVYTNHIHADDLARACWLALWRGRAGRAYHVSDDSDLRMADYYDFAADLYQLPRPARVARDQAQALFSPMQWSFMQESRRLRNQRMKQELRLTLRYPTVAQGLRASA
jgi:nucleoside-diphosphate-sugar epimerase